MKTLLNRFAKDKSGATAIEYGLIASLISVVCIVVWQAVGAGLINTFTEVSTNLN